jgi:hypothetical protein
MAVIRYTGTQIRWPELPITGRQTVWFPGQLEDRSPAEEAALLATGLFQLVAGNSGAAAAPRALVSGEWTAFAGLTRLRLVGTGTVSVDSRSRLGTITSAVFFASATAATDQIEFPYFGDSAVDIRPTITGSLVVELLP